MKVVAKVTRARPPRSGRYVTGPHPARTADSVRALGPTRTSGEHVRQSGRILVVDDDPDTRALLCDFLHHEGFAVQSARDGLEALDRARAEPPSVILLDLMMPRL